MDDLCDDKRKGIHRLILDTQDHALAIREGFREAFPDPDEDEAV